MTPEFAAHNKTYQIIKTEEAQTFKKNVLQQLQLIPKDTPIYMTV